MTRNAAPIATFILAAAALPLALTACGDEGAEPAAPATNNGDANSGGPNGKTDTPNDPTETSCDRRKADALGSNQSLFTPDHVRWACADVEGVNNNNQDDRGQEYCEFFAVVLPPPLAEGSEERPAPVDLGRITRAEYGDGGGLSVETTPLSLDLNDDQIFYLEDHGSEVFGQCVFTSWHQDVPGPVPACLPGGTCPDVMGLAVDAERFQMKFPVNSNSAARDLVQQCFQLPEAGDPANPDDPRHSDFYRGCLLTAQTFGTEWRRSDPAICAAVTRLVECSCAIPGVASAEQLGAALVPPQPADPAAVTLRGFPLGTWSAPDRLPAGCRYTDLGDGSQTIVTCDLTGNDVLDHAADLKRRCIEKYGNDVVVHVPIPREAISCDPDPAGQYTDSCSATPWVVTR